MTRVWEPLMTAEELAHVKLTTRPPVGFGDRPVVISVDNYRAVFGDEPQALLEGVKQWPYTCGLHGWKALPHIQGVLKAARAAGIPVIHSTALAEVPNWIESTRRDPEKTAQEAAAADRQRRQWHIVPELAPLPGELVLYKATPSVFQGTALVAQLIHLRADTIIVAGNSTSGCIRSTVVDGCALRFRMIVPEECVFDRHPTTHAMNLFDLNQKYADVLPVGDVLRYLEAKAKA